MKFILSNQRIVVFGSTGMVGKAVLRALGREGYSMVLSPSRKELNLLDRNDVQKWFEKFKPNVVILAAAKVGGIFANNEYPADFILENLKIQTNIIECSWKNNIKKFLFLGSSCIYPKYASQPIKEEELLSGPLEPTNQWYAVAKIAGLKLCEALNKQYNFNSICLMPTNLYGPGDNYHKNNSHVVPGLINRFYDAKLKKEEKVLCWGSGQPFREFLHVDDLAEACLFTLENWDINDDFAPKDVHGQKLSYLNVGTGNDITISELARLIAQIIGFKGKILWDNSKPDGTPRKQLDVGRIKQLGWKPKITLEKGLKDTINLFLEQQS
mgnify:CR=1 FL=1|tara:strand:+ start:254 stop:1231 length:978 start_codon:yes stop_codon:yes gene_type:complete